MYYKAILNDEDDTFRIEEVDDEECKACCGHGAYGYHVNGQGYGTFTVGETKDAAVDAMRYSLRKELEELTRSYWRHRRRLEMVHL